MRTALLLGVNHPARWPPFICSLLVSASGLVAVNTDRGSLFHECDFNFETYYTKSAKLAVNVRGNVGRDHLLRYRADITRY